MTEDAHDISEPFGHVRSLTTATPRSSQHDVEGRGERAAGVVPAPSEPDEERRVFDLLGKPGRGGVGEGEGDGGRFSCSLKLHET